MDKCAKCQGKVEYAVSILIGPVADPTLAGAASGVLCASCFAAFITATGGYLLPKEVTRKAMGLSESTPAPVDRKDIN